MTAYRLCPVKTGLSPLPNDAAIDTRVNVRFRKIIVRAAKRPMSQIGQICQLP